MRIAIVLLTLLMGCGADPTPKPFSCEITDVASRPTPPAELVAQVGSDVDQQYGRGNLWVLLPNPGLTRQYHAENGPPYGLKLPWIRLESGRIELYADRIDSTAPRVNGDVLDGYGDIGFQSSAITVPVAGCWRITGRLNRTEVVIVWWFGP